ncbi:MAG: glycosyltransferase [Oceanicaulis sp.]|nr:glycosyltransferase [Oceanicaulis sp.]
MAPDQQSWPGDTRFNRQEPWAHNAHSGAHRFAWQFLGTASLVFGAWYLWWRWTVSINWDAAWFSVPLVVAETAAFFGLILFTINLWSSRSPRRQLPPAKISETLAVDPDEDRPLIVDVFFTTYNENPELVRLGLRDARKIEYPHPIDLRIHVLDDGRRTAMEAVAAEESANYITRDNNFGYKAGNLRNAMESTIGDFVVIFDADTRPFPEFLTATLGYFRDPKVAWVQTPQWFWDIPPGVPLHAAWRRRVGRIGGWLGRRVEALIGPVRLGEDPFGNDPQMFYDFIQHRRNWANASFCCGAASVQRREALMESAVRTWTAQIDALSDREDRRITRMTGEIALFEAVRYTARMSRAGEIEFTPFKLHVSEDLYTSIALHSDRDRGWKSVMHPEVVSRMMSPSDLLSWTIQRFKYAGGTLDILRNDNPLARSGLTAPQKLMYGATFYSYLSPLWNIIFLISPIIFLVSGVAPVATYSLDFFLHIIPFLVLNEIAQMVGLWGTPVMKGRRWYIAMFPLTLGALWAVIRGRKISFTVTPKDRASGRYLKLVRWQILLLLVNAAALVYGWSLFAQGASGYTLGAMIVNTFWSGNNMLALSVIIKAAFWRPDPEFDLPVMEAFQHEKP